MLRKIINNKTYLFWLALLLIVVKLALLPFAQVNDADAVSRTFLAVAWKENPVWIISNVWAPFYFYMNGFFLSFVDSYLYTIPVVNIFFSAFMLIPFYYFVKREFNSKGAIYTTFFLAISPVLFRISFMALSEIPYLFFLVLTLNLISKGSRQNSKILITLAGLSITIASGFRYESWIITFFLFAALLLKRKWKEGLLFGMVASVFPVLWLFTCWHTTGDPLISFKWAKEAYVNNGFSGMESLLRRFWFFPFSWYIALGPVVTFLVLKYIFRDFRNKQDRALSVDWSLIFWAMLMVFEYNCFKGALLLQHRFTGTLVLFSLPFAANYFNDFSFRKIRLAAISIVLVVGLSFVYNTDGIKPVPRLRDRSVQNISDIVHGNLTSTSCLITDFAGWDNTYFIALNCGINPKQIVMLPDNDSKVDSSSYAIIHATMAKFDKGLIIFRNGSKFSKEAVIEKDHLIFRFSIDDTLKTEKIYSDEKLAVMKWRRR